MSSTKTTSPRTTRHVSKRQALVVLVLVLLILLVSGLVVRGTWADIKPQMTHSSAEGLLTQLIQTADGHKHVRVATVVDFPMEDVWKVVTDYEHFPEILPNVKSCQSTLTPAGNYQVQGVLSTLLGDWAFGTQVRHEEYTNDSQAVWREPGGDFVVNQGSCLLAPMGPDRTLLICTLEVEVVRYPQFLVNNYLLSRLPVAVGAIPRRLQTAKGAGTGN
jgi:uncharacterized membrane protein